MSEHRLPTVEQIERRAYELYLERGCDDGHDVADWLAAEKELTELSEQSASGTPSAHAARAGQGPTLARAESGSVSQAPNRSQGRTMTKWDRPWIR
jgi:Protein of unknown function (DUF2934)